MQVGLSPSIRHILLPQPFTFETFTLDPILSDFVSKGLKIVVVLLPLSQRPERNILAH